MFANAQLNNRSMQNWIKELANFNEILNLNLASWENFQKIICPNKAYDSFLELITSFYEAAFAKVKIKIKTKNLLSLWITKGLLKSSKAKVIYDKFFKT